MRYSNIDMSKSDHCEWPVQGFKLSASPRSASTKPINHRVTQRRTIEPVLSLNRCRVTKNHQHVPTSIKHQQQLQHAYNQHQLIIQSSISHLHHPNPPANTSTNNPHQFSSHLLHNPTHTNPSKQEPANTHHITTPALREPKKSKKIQTLNSPKKHHP